MAKIKVICGGCGIVYTDAHGNARHALKTPESGPFECDDVQAGRLVAAGVAEYVNGREGSVHDWKEVADPAPHTDEQQEKQADGSQEPEKITGHLDPEQLETMTTEQLKALAADMGADVTGCRKKADYIAAIVSVEVEVETYATVDYPNEDDGDELPELTAADPE